MYMYKSTACIKFSSFIGERRNRCIENVKKTGLNGLKTKAPFTLLKMFDMAQIKMVHVPKK